MRARALLAAVTILLVGLASPAASAPPAATAPPSDSGGDPTKINLMGVWAHPDDDTSIIGPCGVWYHQYDIRCGIIMHTRGEGGSNSVGTERGPDLGLRRENEDRASHFRSGTIDIFNTDLVDFFFNQSAPLTEQIWGHETTLERTVRIIRETRPDVMVGFTPSFGAGHGHHQYSGRMIWEAIRAAADPTMFPEQLTGPDALEPWLVKKTTSGGSTAGSGGQNAPDCTVGFTPGANNPFTVHGVWLGYDSPYKWLEGNVQGQTPGTSKIWAQLHREGNRAHPTQARLMEMGLLPPSCSRWGVTQSFVPMQPNSSPLAGLDDALFYGATIPDPGGMPLGSLFYLTTQDYFQAPGVPFDVTVHALSGDGDLPAGEVGLDVPAGWEVTPAQPFGPISPEAESRATFTVTPSPTAATTRFKISANVTTGAATGYNETVVEIVPPVEGRFQRWGNFVNFDNWAEEHTFVAGRANAVQRIGAGETITVPVVVTNRSDVPQSGSVTLSPPGVYSLDAASKPYTNLAPGAEATIEFLLTHTNPDAPGGNIANVGITTAFSEPAGAASETLQLTVVPTTVIHEAPAAPTLDAVDSPGEYTGPALDLSRIWQGPQCNPQGVQCGAGSYAKVNWFEDDLYIFAHVIDNVQSAAATPEGCFGHWLVDSVELLLDPRGDSVDTSTTFKMGVFPFTDDPTGGAGQGVNGPCWSRDADNHQGYSSGPLADTIEGAPNAPGFEVATDAILNEDRVWEGGSYNIEVRVPLEILPAAVGPTSAPPTGSSATNDVDPTYMGLNITPYDSDNQNFVGNRRMAWSPFGAQQAEPYRWGHAYLEGYAPPAERPTTSADPIVPDTAMRSVESPQTIWQSAINGVTMAGLTPTDGLELSNVRLGQSSVDLDLDATEAGMAHVFLWSGEHGYVPVFESSCPDDYDGFTACSTDDGAPPPWGTDMGGRIVERLDVDVQPGSQRVSVAIDDPAYRTLRANGSALVSFDNGREGVKAWYFPLAQSHRPPVRNAPTYNTVDAGSSVPVNIADGGVNNLAPGFPRLQPIVCGLGAGTDAAVPTTGHVAGRSGNYVWQTDADLQGTCGRLDLRLQDGTTHSSYFEFR